VDTPLEAKLGQIAKELHLIDLDRALVAIAAGRLSAVAVRYQSARASRAGLLMTFGSPGQAGRDC
jgi:hypothetical protein